MKKVLMVNEFSQLSTGYSVYGREVLSRLHDSGKYEIAELAEYAHKDDPRIKNVPWKVYPNLPNTDEEKAEYGANPINAFGAWKFEDTCLDFKPDIVFSILDPWMFEFQCNSPYRKHYNHVLMPTVDSRPQKDSYISLINSADAVLTYQEWSGEVLKNQSGNFINYQGTASPSAAEEFCILPNKKQIRQQLGISPEAKIIGTVMRNQPRKLFPDLFYSFRKFLDQTKHEDVYLYCHTSYPDNGWDLPYLMNEQGITSKVFFTYVCGKCTFAFPSLFKGAVTPCSKCGNVTAGLSNVQRSVNNNILAMIYNIFDVYVQYSSREGMGMPMVEAAACGVPVMGTDFSAMEDVVRKLNGYPIPVKALTRDPHLGCFVAAPDNIKFVSMLEEYFDMPESMRLAKGHQARIGMENNYQWDETVEKWMEVFDSMPSKNTWDSMPELHKPAKPSQALERMSHSEYVKWLIKEVLGDDSRLNSHIEASLLKDLNYGVTLQRVGTSYMNEDSTMFGKANYEPFDRERAYKQMVQLCNIRNHWEQLRGMKI